MATRIEDFVTIASIIKREIRKRKKQKKPKDEVPRNIPNANTSEGYSLFKKKNNKKKRDKIMLQNDENNKHLIQDKIKYSNLSKDGFPRNINISNISEGDSLFTENKKKKKRDKIMVQNDNNFKNDIGTLKVDEFYNENYDDNDKHLYLDETMDSNFNKDEMKRRISIANAPEDDLLSKKKKKKKKGDKKMVQNDENMNDHIGTLKVDEFYNETYDDNDKHLYLDETMDSNFNKDELKRRISIANASEEDLLSTKKKKKKKGDKKMVQNDENMNDHIGTLKVDEFYNETYDDNDKHLYLDETMDSNFNKDELKRRISIANASEEDLLSTKKKKKKKGDKKMVQNDENMNDHIGILKVDEFYNETYDDNDKHLYLDETMDSNFNKDELKRRISIANASEEDLLSTKKKKKKKGDKKMVQNDENMNDHIGTLKVDEFYNETYDDNDKHLYLDETMDSNFNKDELKRRISIANASEEDLLSKKKKKKKKGDKKMVQNDENMNDHIGTLKVDEFYNETYDDNDKHLYLDETMDSNFNKDELKRRISIANASEEDLLSKKKKKKKKGDKKMVQNDENMNDHIGTLKVDEFYNETYDDNDKHLYLDETMDSNFNKDELKRRISIANASEEDLLFQKKKKKKKDKKMDKYLKKHKATLKVEQFYNDTCDDKVNYLNKINIIASNLNEDNSTKSIQIANASEDDDELTLLISPLKKSMLKKKKSKAKKEDTESSKCVSIQKNLKNMEDLKICISEEQSNEIHNDPAMIKTPYNSRILKVHEEEYPVLLQKLFKKKKKDKKKSIKAVPNKELVSPKKLNKRKRQTTDKEYSQNDFLQSVDMNVETYYDGNNSIDDDGEKKLELFDSSDDHTSEYRTMTDTDFTMIHTSYNSRTSKVRKEGYPELILKILKNKKREQKKVIKALTRKEIMSPEKSNKRKQAATDKEYAKNDSPQPVAMDMETYDSNNYIGGDGEMKLEILDSRDDHTSEYRTITDTGMYFGQYCNQTFKNINGVHSHENVLTGNTPLQCDVCFKTFSCKSKLHIHKRTHTGEKPYACNVCGNSFSRKDHLIIHKRTHSGERPYACDVCGNSFSHQSTLVLHTRTHTGEKPYACNVCGNSFSRKDHLVIHKRKHSGERPYACDVCGNSFSHQSTLVLHTRTHTGEKPYACDVCGHSFTQQSDLIKHTRTHTGEKPYACNVCGRSFTQQSSLVVHYRIHTGERPYECGHCEKKFKSSSECTKHTRRVHIKCL